MIIIVLSIFTQKGIIIQKKEAILEKINILKKV